MIFGEILDSAYFEHIKHFVPFCIADRTQSALFLEKFIAIANPISRLQNSVNRWALFTLESRKRILNQLVNTSMAWKFLIGRRKAYVLVIKDIGVQRLGSYVIENFFLEKFDHRFTELHVIDMGVSGVH